jgi:hypothetical protein
MGQSHMNLHIIKSFQIVLFNIYLPYRGYITIESFIHKGHYIKVY